MRAIGTETGCDIENVTAVNPGAHYGKTWLIGIYAGHYYVHFVIEADTVTDALDEFADSEWGHMIAIPEEDYAEYGIETDSPTCSFLGNSGTPCDIDEVRICGRENAKIPWPCRYYGGGLPAKGADPVKLALSGWEPKPIK